MQGLPTRVNLTPVKFNLLSSYFVAPLELSFFFLLVSLSKMSRDDAPPPPSEDVIFDVPRRRVYTSAINHSDFNYDTEVNRRASIHDDGIPVSE